jgi:glycosyltransferase involved in cell wall biosynthesis
MLLPADQPSAPQIVIAVTVPISLPLFGGIPEKLFRNGWRVHIVAGEPVDASKRSPGVQFHVVPMRRAISPIADIGAISKFRRLLREIRPDIVLAATPKASLVGLLAARLAGVPNRIFHVWGCRWDRGRGGKTWLVRQADRVACACSTEVVPVSRSLGELLREHRITKRPIVPIGEGGTKGVDLDRFHPRETPKPAGEPPVIGFLGRLSRDKGIGWLPEVLARVRATIPEVRCLVVGGEDRADPPDPATIDALRGDPAVQMPGAVSDVPAAIRRMDVLCFPSLREGLPNAVIEAAACGVPTVGWDATGTRDAIRDGETGFLVGPGDSARMASRIIELLTSPERRSRMGHAARTLVARHWDARIVERGMLRRLEELVPPRTAP